MGAVPRLNIRRASPGGDFFGDKLRPHLCGRFLLDQCNGIAGRGWHMQNAMKNRSQRAITITLILAVDS